LQLPARDVDLFYDLYFPFLAYANEKTHALPGQSLPEKPKRMYMEDASAIRDRLYERPELIDSYISENPHRLGQAHLDIVRSWRGYVKGRFVVMRHLKEHTVFLSTEGQQMAFGVLGLREPLEAILGQRLPVLVDAVLLPSRDRIVYDGILHPYSVLFGAGIKREMKEGYEMAVAKYGIVTSLPVPGEARELEDAERLRLYLRDEHSRERYAEDVERLVGKSPDLLAIYYREMGKVHARRLGKELRSLGISDAWFGVIGDMVVASGPSKEDLERTLERVLPADRLGHVHVFRVRAR